MSKWLLLVEREPYFEVSDWKVIEDYLSKLNGHVPSMVILRRKAKGELVIHGGNLLADKSRIYYVNYWYEFTDQLFDEQEEEGIGDLYPYSTYFELVDETKSEEEEQFIKISQLSVMPANVCVSWDLMIKAVKYFYDHDGELNPELTWREFDM